MINIFSSIRKPVFLWLFLAISITGAGQNTISPYSIFGPGEIQNRGFTRSTGMGGAGIALVSDENLNNQNPASLNGIDSLNFISEMGAEAKYSGLSSGGHNEQALLGNLRNLAIGFRYNKWLAASIGVSPFSHVGYNITLENQVEGTNSYYTSTFVGSGGISQFYFTNSVKLLKNLSLGVNTSFMFGSLTQDEQIAETDIVPQYQVTRMDFMKSIYFDYGLLYTLHSRKTDFSLGLIYANRQRLHSKHILQIKDESYTVVKNIETNTDYLEIPDSYGIGIGIKRPGRFLALADYRFQRWSEVRYPIQKSKFSDSHRVSVGLEFTPWEKRVTNSFYKNCDYRIGFNYEISYLTFGNNPIDDKSISLGVTMPLPGRISSMSLTLKAGSKGTASNRLIRENYALMQVGFSLTEFWFIRRQYE
jgi:hypothetical protein